MWKFIALLLGSVATATTTATTLTTSENATSTFGVVNSPIVSIPGSGYIQGNRSQYVNSVYNFKGVPFVSAPTGDLRWKHAPHGGAWNGTIQCTEFKPPCPQKGVDSYSEDCLYLNIWVPDSATFNNTYPNPNGIGVLPNATNSKLPVFIWIYGGRYVAGSSSDPLYDAAGLAAKGVIVITLNYRLGALGFLAHPELSALSKSGTSGNYGLVDQQASFHWTNENIAAFGGDPNRVTIGGQSAGAASVIDHVNCPMAAGLFQGAIAESGARYPSDPLIGSLAQSYRTLAEAEEQGIAYIQSLNISNMTEARALPVETFVDGSSLPDTTYVGTVFENSTIYQEPPFFRPVLDGYVLPETYAALLTSGNHSIVPVLTGNNKDESGASTAPGFSVANYSSINDLYFGSVGLASEYFKLYPIGPSGASADRSSNDFFRDQSRIGTWLWANEYSAGSYRNTSGNGMFDVYSYYWTHAPPGQSTGAYHESEINYVFNNLYATDLPWTTEDYAIADKMSSYWANFIATGDPNGDGLEEWPVNSKDSPVTMELGDAYRAIPVAGDEKISFLENWFSHWRVY